MLIQTLIHWGPCKKIWQFKENSVWNRITSCYVKQWCTTTCVHAYIRPEHLQVLHRLYCRGHATMAANTQHEYQMEACLDYSWLIHVLSSVVPSHAALSMGSKNVRIDWKSCFDWAPSKLTEKRADQPKSKICLDKPVLWTLSAWITMSWLCISMKIAWTKQMTGNCGWKVPPSCLEKRIALFVLCFQHYAQTFSGKRMYFLRQIPSKLCFTIRAACCLRLTTMALQVFKLWPYGLQIWQID